MAGLLAETCRRRNYNESMSIKLKCICCLLTHFINYLSISPVYDILHKWHPHVKSINIICFKWSQLSAHYSLVHLFQLLYMFRATMCPSSGELNVSDATQVFFTLYGWLSGWLFQLLYMFRATMCPSSGELTVPMWHGYFSLSMGGCLVCADQTTTHTEWKIAVSHRYSKFSWW